MDVLIKRGEGGEKRKVGGRRRECAQSQHQHSSHLPFTHLRCV